MLISSSPRPPLGSNVKSHHGRGELHMSYMVAQVMSRVYIIIGTLSLRVFLLSMFELSTTFCRASCEAVIERYYRNSAPPYVGFNTESEARNSFNSFQTLGQLPKGIFFPVSLRPINGLPVLQPQTPQRRNRPPTSLSSRTTVSPPPSLLPPSSRLVASSGSHIPIQRNMVPASTQAYQPSHLVVTSSLPVSTQVNEDLSFYVVIEGHAPGIYGSQYALIV